MSTSNKKSKTNAAKVEAKTAKVEAKTAKVEAKTAKVEAKAQKAQKKERTVSPSKEARDEAAQIVSALVAAAKDARKRAYAPYSNYKVGAAVLTESGDVFIGCNVENASYGATVCAERGAIMQMIAAGGKRPVAAAVVTQGKVGGSPCGICRQVLAEFASDMTIILAGESGGPEDMRITALSDLLPDAFTSSSLNGKKKH
jgi:cytidine deaminase